MHLLLTDRLACPRCGPAFGLILLADEVAERRVLEGSLGCPNCRERYPVRGGFADLRPPPRGPLPEPPAPSEPAGGEEPGASATPPPAAAGGGDPAAAAGSGPASDAGTDPAMRLAALLGVSGGSGMILLAGPVAALAARLAALLEEVEVVVVDAARAREAEAPGVSRVAAGPRLPFFTGMFRAVALDGEAARSLLGEGVRLVQRAGRLVLFGSAAEDPPEGLSEAGMELLLHENEVVVAARR